MMRQLEGTLGVVESVDPTHYTCIIRTEHGLHYDVPITPVFLSPNGQGMWFLPEVGTRVLVGTVGKGTRNEYTFLIGAAFAVDQDPLEVDEDAVSDGTTEEDIINVDFRNNRAVHQPGDIVLSSSDRNFMIMRKGGIIELGATQVAKRFYIPLQNVIRDLCQIYEMQNSAGLFQMVRKEGDLTWGKTEVEVPSPAPDGEVNIETIEIDKVPTEMNLRVKQFESDAAPMISIDLGNITRTSIEEEGDGGAEEATEDEDGETPSPGATGSRAHSFYTELAENGLANLVARININNRLKVFVDKNGNYTTETSGAEIHTHSGPRSENIFRGNYIEEFKGSFTGFYNTVNEEITNTKTVQAGREIITSVGTVEEPETTWRLSSSGAELETEGNVKVSGSETVIEADGRLTLKAGSDIALSCDNLVLSSVGTVNNVFAGSNTQTILNADQSPVAYRIINESTGELQIHNSLGEIRLSSFGRPGLGGLAGIGLPGLGSLSQIRIKPNGTISVDFLAGGVTTNSLEVNATGAALRGAAGAFEISIDNAGLVNLGGPVAGAGNGRVVTTLTHPVCFVTGLPIMGSTTVGAFGGVPTPGPATPTTFVADPT